MSADTTKKYSGFEDFPNGFFMVLLPVSLLSIRFSCLIGSILEALACVYCSCLLLLGSGSPSGFLEDDGVKHAIALSIARFFLQ